MTTRRILATSGGFLSAGEDLSPGQTLLRALQLTKKKRPRICFIMTASGDNPDYIAKSYKAMSTLSCDVSHIQLFTQPNVPVRDEILQADLIWVGGGSVANLLALWRLHGVDEALRQAYEKGTILAGVSAGSICWFLGGPTDSFGKKLQLVKNGLGLLPFGNGVHFDSEQERRPFSHNLINTNVFDRIYATDDQVGILFENEMAVEVITDAIASSHDDGPAAYLLEKSDGICKESRLPRGLITY